MNEIKIQKYKFDDDMKKLALQLLGQLQECEEISEFADVEVEGFSEQKKDGTYRVYFSFLVDKPEGKPTIFCLY